MALEGLVVPVFVNAIGILEHVRFITTLKAFCTTVFPGDILRLFAQG